MTQNFTGGDDSEVLYRDAVGRTLTSRDLSTSWETPSPSAPVPEEARTLHERGREAGAKGDYRVAIDAFISATELAPGWPAPIYDLAFTYLLMDDPALAEKHYARVDALAPRGFFTAKTFLDSLRRERSGEIPAGFSKAYAMTEHMEPSAKLPLLRGIVEKFPNYPPAWKDLANLLDDDDERIAAVERGLEGQPDPETHGLLLVDRALILARRNAVPEAVQILGDLALHPSSTVMTEMMAKMALAQLLGVPLPSSP